ncbi:MAG TPA: hypothetical protein VII94_01325 [Candidatus Saccharimonadales bacterium]
MSDEVDYVDELRRKIFDLEKELYRYTNGECAWKERYHSDDQFTEEQYNKTIISPVALGSPGESTINRTITAEELRTGLIEDEDE